MIRHFPDRDTFRDLSRRFPIVPVWRVVLADAQTPVAAYLRIQREMPDAFLLESVEGQQRWARYSFLGGDSFAKVTAKDGGVHVEGDPPVTPEPAEPPLAYIKRLLEACRAPRLDDPAPLHGGAVGFIGYDCVRELEHLPQAPPDDLGLPDLCLLLTRTLCVFDHFTQKATVITNVAMPSDVDRAYDDAIDRCDAMVESLSVPLAAPRSNVPIDVDVRFDPTVDDDEYARWVDRARQYIHAGDIFQVVPSRRFDAPLDASAFDAYRILRTLNPSPYMYFLRFAEGPHAALEIAGSSPEPLVRVAGDSIITRPIAGTLPRGATDEEDAALERELLADDKERAEHIMLVDLARNDVGRVARFGSVQVDDLMIVERYSHVMHIVSSVRGTLREDMAPFDALTACFPAGTMSGAPKVRAMQVIDELEVTRRGPYAGVVGYFDFSGNLDTCITIRTIVATGGRAYVQAGAGVVADSVPDKEAAETRHKAAAVLTAAAAAERFETGG